MTKMKLILGRIVSLTSLLVTVGLLVSGCATAPEPEFTTAPVLDTTNRPDVIVDGKGYRLQIGDTVGVIFSGTDPAIPAHGEQVKEDGNITLPLIGAVKAVGKTDLELQKEIHGRYVPKYYVRLVVNVNISSPNLVFYVTGEVRAPGSKPWNTVGVTVTQALSVAGGPTEFARKSRVQLKRANGTKETIDYEKALQNPKLDHKVFPGDSIHVPRRIF
jgi:polysaccharide biosynthesis/export protein